MKNYSRSICSTCSHALYCSLTTDMSNINSCSEYAHYLDENKDYPPVQSAEKGRAAQQKNESQELVLN